MALANPLLCIGTCIAVLIIGLAGLSHGFPYGVDPGEAPLRLYIGFALISGGIWFLLPGLLKRSEASRPLFVAAICLGLAMRGAMFFSLPVLEDDSYRYLWDGAVTANGINPYKYAPAEAAIEGVFGDQNTDLIAPDLKKLQALAAQYPETHSRINYPYLSTIYPPLTQAAFAIAYRLDPFALNGWRWVLLASDLIALSLLTRLLTAHNRNRLWALLYWWNPVVIVQGFGAGHMDLVILPFLLGALLLAQKQRLNGSVIALAAAAAVKLWPAILLPILVRPLLRQPAKLGATFGLFGLFVTLALLPQIFHALQPDAGLNAYASDWRTHAFLFAVLEDVVLRGFNDPGFLARIFVVMSVISLTAYLSLRPSYRAKQIPILCAMIIASLIFLSPTGYPWYLIWLAPFLAFLPKAGLCALFVTAPLYWLRFELGDDSLFYQRVVIPFAFGLPLALLFFPFFQRGQRLE